VKLRSLIIALLLLSFLVPAVCAVYIPDQARADDGQAQAISAVDPPVPTLYSSDQSGPIKRYLSDDPNDYVLVPGNDPDMMYALGETPVETEPVAISAPKATSTNMPSYVASPPTVPAILSKAAGTSAETMLPPDFNAPADSSKFFPSISRLQHINAVTMGYDVSKIGNIVMPSISGITSAGMPEFKFPALFG
jgi:hypothetical protein